MHPTKHNRALRIAGFLAAVWAIGAALQPTSTYHLAPILVAGVMPTIVGARSKGTLAAVTAVGIGLAIVTSLALAGLDWLRGPTLLPYGGALAEAITFSAIGGIGAAAIATAIAQVQLESAA